MKKTEFNLLQANKRLQGGVYILTQKPPNTTLAISTISKGQNYFEDALASFEQAKKQGKSTNDMLVTLSIAAKKHREVLQGVRKSVPASFSVQFAVLEKRALDIERRVNILIQNSRKK